MNLVTLLNNNMQKKRTIVGIISIISIVAAGAVFIVTASFRGIETGQEAGSMGTVVIPAETGREVEQILSLRKIAHEAQEKPQGRQVAVSSLLVALGDSAWGVRYEAAQLLGKLGAAEVLSELEAVATTDPQSFVREEADHSLWKIRYAHTQDKLGILMDALSDDCLNVGVGVCLWAVDELVNMGDMRYWTDIQRAVTSLYGDDPRTKQYLRTARKKIQLLSNYSRVEALKRAVWNNDRNVREWGLSQIAQSKDKDMSSFLHTELKKIEDKFIEAATPRDEKRLNALTQQYSDYYCDLVDVVEQLGSSEEIDEEIREHLCAVL